MKIPKQIMALSALAIATLVTACGGGSSSSAPASRDDVVSAGIITEFGSVFVNDRRYDTSGAQIKSADDDSLIDIINDDSNLALLKTYLGLGQVIVLRGSTAEDGSNGIANTIYIDNQLIGPVDTGSVNNTNATFTVLGQTVTVGPDTIIDDSIIERVIGSEVSDDLRFADIEQRTSQAVTLTELLTVGLIGEKVVEVSGFSSLDGVEATRIEDVNNRDRSNGSSSSSASGEVEVKGFVSNLTAGQFTINSLTVTYADSALDAEDFSGRVLADGDFVEVKGTVASNILDASEIELEDSFPGGSSSSGASSSSSSGASSSSSSGASSSSSSGASSSSSSGASSSSSSGASSSSSSSRIEVEGIITEVRTGDSTIVIHGLVITVQNVAQFSVGQRVKIKGRLQDDGGVELSLEGDDSGIEDSSVEDNVRIEDQALTVTASTVTTRLGVTIDISARTRVDGAGVDGSAVEARGFLLDGNVVWTRVEFDDEGTSECRLRGPVQGTTPTTAFSIQGVEVDVSQITSSSGSSSSSSSSTGFRDAADTAITREAFFDQLNVGDVVQAQSIDLGCSDGALVADEVEFENSSNFSSSSSSSGASSSSSGASSSSSSGASSSSSSGASSSSSS